MSDRNSTRRIKQRRKLRQVVEVNQMLRDANTLAQPNLLNTVHAFFPSPPGTAKGYPGSEDATAGKRLWEEALRLQEHDPTENPHTRALNARGAGFKTRSDQTIRCINTDARKQFQRPGISQAFVPLSEART